MKLSSKPSNTRRPAEKVHGIRVDWESLITPATLIAAGFYRELKGGKRRQNIRSFCAAMGVSEDLYHSIKGGRREPSEEFRVKAARILGKPEDVLFRRRIEGQR